jgi:predicted nucleotidyltransferase component of viral defense system
MIPSNDIIEWSDTAPWISSEQVEQDLVICRSLVEIFSDAYLSEHLAFRGGTALHKLYLTSHARYSEDIDLVQKKPGPIKSIIESLRKVLSFLGDPKVKQKSNNNTLIFRFDSESTPPMPMRLKVEINCREHFSILGYKESDFSVDTRWFKGSAQIQTYNLEELLGTKIRALYQRKKGRDLFDLYQALAILKPDPGIILSCYGSYMDYNRVKKPTKKQFTNNLTEKLSDIEFLNDTNGLLRAGGIYRPMEAFEFLHEELFSKF